MGKNNYMQGQLWVFLQKSAWFFTVLGPIKANHTDHFIKIFVQK